MLTRSELALGSPIARLAVTLLLMASLNFAFTACDGNGKPGHDEKRASDARSATNARAIKGKGHGSLQEALDNAEQTPTMRIQIYLNLIKEGIPPDQAEHVFKSILSNVGSGQDRDDLLQAFFFDSMSSIMDGLILLRGGELRKSELERAYLGLACRIGIKRDSTILDELTAIGDGLSEREIYALTSGLSFRVDPAFSSRIFGYESNLTAATQADKNQYFNEAYLILSSLLDRQKPGIASAAYSNFFDNAARSAPFEAWNKLAGLAVAHPEIAESESDSQGIVANMARQDPEQTLKILVDSGFGQVGTNSRTAFDSWIKKDSKAAFDWLKMASSGLHSEQLDGCNAAVAYYHMQSNDVGEARKIASSISDPALRSKVEGQIWGMERDSLRNEVVRDPAGTMQGIVSRQSKYSDYWIEEAMSTWISKEPEKAEDWYQKNWDSLPPTQSQYVAAAYAKNALGHGDTETARQWAALIQNAKIRERIESSITNAAAAGEN